jgi:hypothetical protein
MKVSHQSRIFTTLAALLPPKLLSVELCVGAAKQLTENAD